MPDDALVFEDPVRDAEAPSTHVLLVGVGHYAYGRGPGASLVGGDLEQLTSPPISARAMADWFLNSFQNREKPLASLSLVISEAQPRPYQSPRDGVAIQPPAATLDGVQDAAKCWAARAGANKENLAVFYFCGHGASLGQAAALLLEDFGKPGAEFDGAIEFDTLRGTMRNSPAIQQAFLLDCCRTNADDFYRNETTIGSRIVSIPSLMRGHDTPAQQFVLFPTIDGEEAFGIKDKVSAFTSSIIDAMSFAAADGSTGVWRTTTAKLFDAVNILVSYRVPPALVRRSKPNALDASSFEFNFIPEPTTARSYVTISNLDLWGDVELTCEREDSDEPLQHRSSRDAENETCCSFTLNEGRWCFKGSLPNPPPPTVADCTRSLRVPVAYVKLEVQP